MGNNEYYEHTARHCLAKARHDGLRAVMKAYLRIKCRVLNLAIDENPHVVLHHEGLDIGSLVFLVDLLHQLPAYMMCKPRV